MVETFLCVITMMKLLVIFTNGQMRLKLLKLIKSFFNPASAGAGEAGDVSVASLMKRDRECATSLDDEDLQDMYELILEVGE